MARLWQLTLPLLADDWDSLAAGLCDCLQIAKVETSVAAERGVWDSDRLARLSGAPRRAHWELKTEDGTTVATVRPLRTMRGPTWHVDIAGFPAARGQTSFPDLPTAIAFVRDVLKGRPAVPS